MRLRVVGVKYVGRVTLAKAQAVSSRSRIKHVKQRRQRPGSWMLNATWQKKWRNNEPKPTTSTFTSSSKRINEKYVSETVLAAVNTYPLTVSDSADGNHHVRIIWKIPSDFTTPLASCEAYSAKHNRSATTDN